MHSARFEIVCKRFCLPPLNSLLIPYRRPTHPCSPCSVAFLPLTIPQLTPLQSLSYSVQTSDLLPFNRFLTPLMTPIQSHFYPLAIPQLTPLQLHFYPLTNVRLTPLQSLSYSLTIVLDPYKCPTYPSSNVLLTVTTGCRVRSGRLTRTSRGVDEHLCNESGAGLDSQAGDKMY